MSDGTAPADAGWFVDVRRGDADGAVEAIAEGTATEPADWPTLAVETGVVDSEGDYYDWLHEVTLQTARRDLREQERADDQQLIHAVRAMDDCRRQANELAERVAEWAGSRRDDAGTGIEYARRLATTEATDPVERRLVALAGRVVELDEEATDLRQFLERTVPEVAPNLSMLAEPVLAARLIALAGGLESLAKKPSGTVQVLGAEEALFAHLRGTAPSPKHGVIYTHEYVRHTNREHRGSAARALAGKLSIAARIDHYSGDRRPELAQQLEDRIERIRARDSG